MNTKRISSIVLVVGMVLAAEARAVNDLTFSMVPIGGSIVNGNQIVEVEIFAAANRAIRIEGGIHDLPCVISATSGGSGTMTWLSATADADGDGLRGPSSAGVPFLFGPAGLSPVQSSTCAIATTPAIGQSGVNVPAGAIGYLGTHRYVVTDCAAGEFPIHFECSDQPGGVCDNIPEPANSTRAREDVPPGPVAGPLVSIQMIGTTLTVPIAPCCSSFSVVPDCNAYCCEVVQSGCTHFRLDAGMCLPGIYGDIYPGETRGDGLIDADEIHCLLNEFIFGPGDCLSADIWPCGSPNGMVDVDDLLAIIATFIGTPACPDPCE